MYESKYFIFPGTDSFERLASEFPDNTDLLMDKGVYPYDYASTYEVFEGALPPQAAFYNQLKEENVSDRDYQRALSVYQTFDCSSFLDYMLLYVKTDTGKYLLYI